MLSLPAEQIISFTAAGGEINLILPRLVYLCTEMMTCSTIFLFAGAKLSLLSPKEEVSLK